MHFGLGTATIVNQLEVQWSNGKAQILKNIAVNQQINITEDTSGPEITSISVSDTDVDEDETIVFDGSAMDIGGSITKYEWDFDGDNVFDWSSTTKAQTRHTLYSPARFYAKLRVWDDSGYLYTDKTTEFITVNNVPPVADPGSDVTVWEDELVIFDGSESFDTLSDMANLTYNWTFGDDTYSGWNSTPITQHTYSLRGNYDVTLYVKDDNNETAIEGITVTVKNKSPTGKIICDKTLAEDHTLTLKVAANDTISDLPYLLYQWDFGDGNKSTWISVTTIYYAYPNNGEYTIRCTIRDDEGASDQNYVEENILVYNLKPVCFIENDKTTYEDIEVYLNGSATDTKSDQNSLTYLWDFGDGTTSKEFPHGYQNTSHVYTQKGEYQARLIVTDDDSAECSNIVNITVKNVIPKCFVMEDINVIEDETVEFNGFGEDTESDQGALQYSWNFDEFGISNTNWNTSPEFEYRYKNEGAYNAVLMVRDDDGATGFATVKINVFNVAPEAKFLMSANEVVEEELVEFNALPSSDTPSDLSNLIYSWDFNDRSAKVTGSVIYHRFYKADEYNVMLTVTDDNGESDTYRKTITIKNLAPTAKTSVDSIKSFVGTEIIFSGAESTDTVSDRVNLTFEWNFGDTNSDTGEVVIHIYSASGRYKVKLTVSDDDGVTDETSVTVHIEEFTSKESGSKTEVEYGSLALGAGIVIILIIILLIILFLYFRKKPHIDQKEAIETLDTDIDHPQKIAGQPTVIPEIIYPPPGFGQLPLPTRVPDHTKHEQKLTMDKEQIAVEQKESIDSTKVESLPIIKQKQPRLPPAQEKDKKEQEEPAQESSEIEASDVDDKG